MLCALVVGGVAARSAFGSDGSGSLDPVQKVVHRDAGATNRTASASTAVVTTWVTTEHTIVSGGLTRTYLVAEPSPAPTTKVPVVVVLHGANVTAAYEEHRTDFISVATPSLLVYPQGYDESWNAGSCCGAAHSAGVDDEAFVTAVVAQVEADYPVADATHVSVVGYSNGGRLAWALACDDATIFRAVAVYGAVVDKTCATFGPISAMEVVGSADPELTFDSSEPATVSNGFTEPTVTALVAQVRQDDGCSAAQSTAGLGTESTTTWSACTGGRQVALAVYANQAHTWPAGTATTPSAASIMWKFLESVGAV